MEKAYFYETNIGKVFLTEDGEAITGLSLLKTTEEVFLHNMRKDFEIYETELIREAAAQLFEYLSGRRKEFNVKLHPQGTEFQKKVWDALCTIPYGETRSYKQVAYLIGNEKASRAVGMANHNNPIMCFIPCHRVIGAKGALVGFGAGLEVKEELLNLEKKHYLLH